MVFHFQIQYDLYHTYTQINEFLFLKMSWMNEDSLRLKAIDYEAFMIEMER